MTDSLRLTYRNDGDGTGEVTAKAASLGYSGESSGWLDEQIVRRFATDLGQFPLDTQNPPRLLTGYGPRADGTGGFHATIDITVMVLGRRGQLGADISLSTFTWSDDPAYAGGSARMILPTSYQRLAEFGSDLALLVDGYAEEAVLLGETFS